MFEKRKGFTLIELLVVIAIIGTLSGIVLVSMGGARSRARDANRQSDMRQIVSAQEMYYGDKDSYLTGATGEGTTPPIDVYLRGLNDPQCPDAACSGNDNYNWPDNSGALNCSDDNFDADAGQWFCVYAKLENLGHCSSSAYFAASHRGTMIVCNGAPSVDLLCTCFH